MGERHAAWAPLGRNDLRRAGHASRSQHVLFRLRSDRTLWLSAAAVLLALALLLRAAWTAPRSLSEIATLTLTACLAGVTPALLYHAMRRLGRRVPNRRRMLAELLPSAANRVLPGSLEEERVGLNELRVGDVVRVRPREVVPTDGTVLEGRSALDEQRITGEPLPIDKRPGNHVLGGSRNGRGLLLVRVDKTCHDGVLADMLAWLESAEHARGQRMAEVRAVATRIVWAQGGSAVLLTLLARGLSPALTLSELLFLTLSILLAGNPRALVEAASLSLARAVSRGAFLGVLVRSPDAFDGLARTDTLVIDKTETLTEGRPRVVAIVPNPALNASHHAASDGERAVLQVASALSATSEHPFSRAIILRATTLGVVPVEARGSARERKEETSDGAEAGEIARAAASIHNLRSVAGAGIVGTLDGELVGLGNGRLLRTLAVEDITLEAKAEALREHGQSVLFVVRGSTVVGLIGLRDPIKLTTRDALRELEERKVRVVVASGDGERTLQYLAGELDLPEVHGDLDVDAKAELVKTLRAQGRRVAAASNDPALQPMLDAAEVAIVLGSELVPSLAIAALHIFPRDLAALARAYGLARAARRSVRMQVRCAVAYHCAIGAGLGWWGTVSLPRANLHMQLVAFGASGVFAVVLTLLARAVARPARGL